MTTMTVAEIFPKTLLMLEKEMKQLEKKLRKEIKEELSK